MADGKTERRALRNVLGTAMRVQMAVGGLDPEQRKMIPQALRGALDALFDANDVLYELKGVC